VFLYLYRITLDQHTAEDLSQETMVTMVQSLERLKVPNMTAFWAWLYRSAFGKVQHHFRDEGRHRGRHKITLEQCELAKMATKAEMDGLSELARIEMSQTVIKSLNQLKPQHRSVLVLRCFEQMSYARIATILGGTELRARLLFLRAKHSLKRQLSHRGVRREQFVASLTLFGAVTALHSGHASAQVVIGAETLKVGTAASVIGTATTKTAAVLSAASVAVVVGVTVPLLTRPPATLQSTFNYPSAVVHAIDPDGNGWQGVQGGRLVPLQPGAMLSHRSEGEDVPHLLLPEWHSLELRFADMIVDGPGDDVRVISMTTGNEPRVFLTDAKGNECQLPPPQITVAGKWHVAGYDIAGLDLLPEGRCAVRLEGAGRRGPWGGAALFSVQARTPEKDGSTGPALVSLAEPVLQKNTEPHRNQ
jgi:RNA polymerase sigma-70 factor (ECF subfamily)